MLLLAIVFAALLLSPGTAGAQSPQGEELYRRIKEIERTWPLPTPRVTVRVGTFNAVSGVFQFDPQIRSQTITVMADKPRRITVLAAPANAVNVTLEFRFTNSPGPSSVTINGISTFCPGVTGICPVMAIDVGRADDIRFTVRSGPKSATRAFTLVRPTIIGAGAFLVPALPIALVYAPPQGSAAGSSVSYDRVTSVATSRSLTIERGNSTITAGFSQYDALRDKANDAKDFMEAITAPGVGVGVGALAAGGPYAVAALAALELLSGALGSVDISNEAGTTVSSTKELTITDTRGYRTTTPPNEGPGIGDRIIFYRNAKIMWLSVNGEISLCLISAGTQSDFTVGTLANDLSKPAGQRVTGLSDQVIRDLLALDPFVNLGTFALLGPPLLPGPRFVAVEDPSEIQVVNGMPEVTFRHELQKSDLETHTETQSTTEEHRPGWLSFLGIGETEARTIKTSWSQSSGAGHAEGESIEVVAHLNAAAGELFKVRAYYDRLFGTVAFIVPRRNILRD